jgi:alanine racemase
VYFKVIPPQTPVSYGGRWISEEQTRIVTVPVGYGDGYQRRMSGSAQVLIRGKRYPVVGSICMDQLMVNIGWEEAYNGEEVVLLGEQGTEKILAQEHAQWADMIVYEILCAINNRVPRLYMGA